MNPFVATMPAAYERLYRTGEIAEHGEIVARRGSKLIHAELWQSAKGPQLCVVAEDRPGLLALVTDALLTQGMAVQSARAFCRELGKDRFEAVDFLGLHEVGGPEGVSQLDAQGLQAFEKSLGELITVDLAQRSAKAAASAAGEPPTRV